MTTTAPKLSICVPSRNRQFYFQKTIEALMRRARDEVEFVFADNSDDPSIMNGYMAGLKDDPRVVYLPSQDRVLSMLDNWERTVAAATGEWVSVIGDDDFIDPALLDVLDRILAVNPEMESFSWGVAHYVWPSEATPVHNIYVPYNSFVVKIPRSEPHKRMFGWVGATAIPTAGYSIYHGSVRRSLLERVRARFGGRYFEHPVVDYDSAMKVITEGRHFAYCQRPFSIMGSCPKSNSFALSRLEEGRRRNAEFFADLGRNSDEDTDLERFPFSTDMGVSAGVAIVQQWFKDRYGIACKDWEADFAKACVKNTEGYADRQQFELVKEGYEAGFSRWKGGRFLRHYKPVFRERGARQNVTGSSEEGIFIRSDIGGIGTPEALYEIIEAITAVPALVEVREDGLKYPWEEQKQHVGGRMVPVQAAQKRVA